jgi:hypothetical protein
VKSHSSPQGAILRFFSGPLNKRKDVSRKFNLGWNYSNYNMEYPDPKQTPIPNIKSLRQALGSSMVPPNSPIYKPIAF